MRQIHFLVSFLILEITEAVAVLFFCLYIKKTTSLPTRMVEHVMWCHFWFSSSLLGKVACSPAVSCFPLYKSAQLPSYTLEQDVAEAKTTRGDFAAWNFPHGCCVRLLSIAEEKCLSQQLLLLRADFRWWTLLLWTQFHDIEVMHHDLITEPLLALLPFARSFLCHMSSEE